MPTPRRLCLGCFRSAWQHSTNPFLAENTGMAEARACALLTQLLRGVHLPQKGWHGQLKAIMPSTASTRSLQNSFFIRVVNGKEL